MSDCNRNECGECLGDFSYYINQQPAVFNTAQVVTLDCPQGYTCQTVDPINVDAGIAKQIPDLPPYDPNVDPNCDTLCEINRVVIQNAERELIFSLAPSAYAQNEDVTVSCADLGYPDGQATATCAAGTVVYAYDPASVTPVAAQVQANKVAANIAKITLENELAAGSKTCSNIAPTSIWQTGISEVVATATRPAFAGAVNAPVLSLQVGPGVYRLEDGEGLCTANLRVIVNNGFDPPYEQNQGWRWYGGSYRVRYTNCSGGTTEQKITGNYFWDIGLCQSGAIQQDTNVYCDDASSTTAEIVLAADMQKIINDQPAYTDNGSDGTLTMRLTRLSKPTLTPPLKVTLPSLHAEVATFPFGQRWRDSAANPAKTTMDGRTYFDQDLIWTRGPCGASGSYPSYESLNGKEILPSNLAMTVRWSGSFDGSQWQDIPGVPTGTIGGWYVSFILNNYDFGYGVALTAYKLSGADPYGTYIVRPECTVAQMITFGANVSTATDGAALPACTLASEVLTANGLGLLPEIGGVTAQAGDIIMVKDEVDAAKNGIYVVTHVGSPSDSWILTRHQSLSTSVFEDSIQGKIWRVTGGSAAGRYYQTNIITTIDVSDIAFAPLPEITITVAPL